MKEVSTNGELYDIDIVGGPVEFQKKGVEIPPRGALSITSSVRKELLELKMLGDGYITKEDIEKLRQAEKNKFKQHIANEIKKARAQGTRQAAESER